MIFSLIGSTRNLSRVQNVCLLIAANKTRVASRERSSCENQPIKVLEMTSTFISSLNTCRLYHVMPISFAEIAVKIADKKSFSASAAKNQHDDYEPDDGRERTKSNYRTAPGKSISQTDPNESRR